MIKTEFYIFSVINLSQSIFMVPAVLWTRSCTAHRAGTSLPNSPNVPVHKSRAAVPARPCGPPYRLVPRPTRQRSGAVRAKIETITRRIEIEM